MQLIRIALHTCGFIFAVCGLLTHAALAGDATRSFTLASFDEPQAVLPLKQYAGEASGLNMLINPPILYLQNSGRITCILCKESPEVFLRRNEETQVSEMVISLVLKKKLAWGDGHALNRDDVKFTLETMAKGAYPKGQHPILPIQRIEIDKEQDNRIRLVLQHRRSDASQLLAISLLPKHKEVMVKKLASLSADSSEFWNLIKDPGLYYGSYRIADGTSAQLRLVPNRENEWENSPSQELRVRFFSNLQGLAQALQRDEIDQTFNQQINWFQYQELQNLVPKLDQRYEPKLSPGESLEVILLNLRSPILVNPSMRQAVFRAIDRDAINEKFFQNGGLKTEGLLHPELSKRTGEKLVSAFQKGTAEQLLEQANWKKQEDGWRTNEKGERLSLSLSCTESRLKSGWHRSVQNDLQKVGIELKIDQIPEADYIRQTLGHLRFKDAACMRWRLPPLSPPLQLFHGLAIPSAENSYRGSNFSGWEQTAVNRLLESMIREPDTSQLIRLFGRLERHFLSDVPAIPLVYLPELTLNRKAGPDSGISDLQKVLAAYPAGNERSRKGSF